MAMNAGNAECTTGLSKRIYDHWTADERNGFIVPLNETGEGAIRSLAYAVARGVVEEIAANADVTIGTDDGGLQTSGGVATMPPATTQVLSGAVS